MHFTKALSSEITSNYKCRTCLNISGLLCLCVVVHLLQKAVVLKMEMLFGQKKRKKMLMFCSLALLVKIKLCGGNLCESGFFFIVVVFIAVPLI